MSYPQYPQTSETQPGFNGGEPPLWAPNYGAPFPVAVRRFFKKYATVSGRASRSEYWWWALVAIAISIVLNIIINAGTTVSLTSVGAVPSYGPVAVVGFVLAAVWGLATIVPSIALTVRRLHDPNLSGFLVLLNLIPVLGNLAVLILTILPSNPAGQRFDETAAR
ncbi:DUF805 domain-containing protein [Arthrobacter ulcerisalmonis]|uniref:DUF805 domain-containing protein n=1 Tax=Arthrobacter ulcerisalmonis TaxID=2483813 RepID=UPI000F546D53|nr:DUF805 domain-containing protein [Arthrobacter ulcerisalmonis]